MWKLSEVWDLMKCWRGISWGVDDGDRFVPGQKMKYW